MSWDAVMTGATSLSLCARLKGFSFFFFFLPLPQFPRPPIAPPSPWRLKVRCTSPGSLEPMAGLRSQLSVSSTDAAAAQSGLSLRIISRPSSCLWKSAIWSPVSFVIVKNFSLQSCVLDPSQEGAYRFIFNLEFDESTLIQPNVTCFTAAHKSDSFSQRIL